MICIGALITVMVPKGTTLSAYAFFDTVDWVARFFCLDRFINRHVETWNAAHTVPIKIPHAYKVHALGLE